MEIVNRVAQSGIEVYNLEKLWDGAPVLELDLTPFLEQGLLLREKPFRAKVAAHDWAMYQDAHVAVYCSTEALIPAWAYMLVASRLHEARSVGLGTPEEIVRNWFERELADEDWSRYSDRIVVVKGCGSGIVPESAYVTAIQRLMRVARKVMYGEPCSNIPLWRRPKTHAS